MQVNNWVTVVVSLWRGFRVGVPVAGLSVAGGVGDWDGDVAGSQ